MFGQREFAVKVALEHAADLGHGNVAFIDKQQRIFRQILKQGRRRITGITPRQPPRIVFDPFAMTHRFHHLKIKRRTLFNPLCRQKFAFVLELGKAVFKLLLNPGHGLHQGRARGDVVRIGIDRDRIHAGKFMPGQRIKLGQFLNLVPKHRHPPCAVFRMGRENFQNIAAHPECPA